MAFGKPICRGRCTAWGAHPPSTGRMRMCAGRRVGRRPASSSIERGPELARWPTMTLICVVAGPGNRRGTRWVVPGPLDV